MRVTINIEDDEEKTKTSEEQFWESVTDAGWGEADAAESEEQDEDKPKPTFPEVEPKLFLDIVHDSDEFEAAMDRFAHEQPAIYNLFVLGTKLNGNPQSDQLDVSLSNLATFYLALSDAYEQLPG